MLYVINIIGVCMDIIIREELPNEYWDTEYMTKKVFWNLHLPGQWGYIGAEE